MAGEAGTAPAGDKTGVDAGKKPLDAKAKRTRNLEYGGAAAAAVVVVLYLRSKSSSSSSTTNAATQSATPATTPEPGLVTPSTLPTGMPNPGGGFTSPSPSPGQPLPPSTTPPPASTTAPSGPNGVTIVPDSMSGVGTGQPIPTSVQSQIATSNSGYSNEPVGYSPSATAAQNSAAEAYYADPSSTADMYAYDKSIGYGPGSSGNGIPG